MTCKFCPHIADDIAALRTHVQGNHGADWQSFVRSMKLYEQDHAAELGNFCPVCPHKRYIKWGVGNHK